MAVARAEGAVRRQRRQECVDPPDALGLDLVSEIEPVVALEVGLYQPPVAPEGVSEGVDSPGVTA